MPQITLEQSGNIDPAPDHGALFRELHGLLAETAGVRASDCKSRLMVHERFLVGDGEAEGAFVHLSIGLFAGRPAAVKEAIGRGALALLARHYAAARGGRALQITVELRDLARESYFKA